MRVICFFFGGCLGLLVATGVRAQTQTLTGVYQSGHQVDSLQVCDTGKGYLLSGAALGSLQRQMARLRSGQNPYPMLLVRVNGTVVATQRARAADYDGELTIKKLLHSSPVVPDRCMESLGIK